MDPFKNIDHNKSQWLYKQDVLMFVVVFFFGGLINMTVYFTPKGSVMLYGLIPKSMVNDSSQHEGIKKYVRGTNNVHNERAVNKATKKEVALPSTNSVSNLENIAAIDANKVDIRTLKSMGFSTYTAQNWASYLKAGGTFNSVEDLKKIFGIDTTLLLFLSSKIAFPAQHKKKKSNLKNIKIDINLASKTEWQSLYGIGPTLSQRIVKFRDALGGFASINQVAETFGLPDSVFQFNLSKLVMATPPKKLNINTLPEETLKKHPYISWNQARIVIKYREQRGPFRDDVQLTKCGVFTTEELLKLSPHLDYSIGPLTEQTSKTDSLLPHQQDEG